MQWRWTTSCTFTLVSLQWYLAASKTYRGTAGLTPWGDSWTDPWGDSWTNPWGDSWNTLSHLPTDLPTLLFLLAVTPAPKRLLLPRVAVIRSARWSQMKVIVLLFLPLRTVMISSLSAFPLGAMSINSA